MKLSTAQRRAAAKLSVHWMTAYDLDESLPTLRSLVQRKIAESRTDVLGVLFSPRTAIHFRIKQLKEPQ